MFRLYERGLHIARTLRDWYALDPERRMRERRFIPYEIDATRVVQPFDPVAGPQVFTLDGPASRVDGYVDHNLFVTATVETQPGRGIAVQVTPIIVGANGSPDVEQAPGIPSQSALFPNGVPGGTAVPIRGYAQIRSSLSVSVRGRLLLDIRVFGNEPSQIRIRGRGMIVSGATGSEL